MSRKKTYVSPQVTRVKLEPTQAVLSQCSVGVTKTKRDNSTGFCEGSHGGCKQDDAGGDSSATS